MALGASQGESKKNGCCGVGAVNHRLYPKLLQVDTAFLIEHGVTVKASRHFLRNRRRWQQIASQLLGSKLIERHVGVEGIDYPITILPHRARTINAVTVAVGVARLVKPPSAPPFPVVWRCQEAINLTLKCIWAVVGQEFEQIFFFGW